MNIYNYLNKNYLEENLGEILCLLEERSNKLNMNNNIVIDNLNYVKKYERENLKKKEIIFEKEKENKLLKQLYIDKTNEEIVFEQAISHYIKLLNSRNEKLNKKIFICHEKELLINYKNKLINELINLNIKETNESNKNYINKNEINKKKNTNNINNRKFKDIYVRPKLNKIQKNNISKINKENNNLKVNNSLNDLRNKKIIFINEKTDSKKQNKTYIKNKPKRSSSYIFNESKFDNLNEEFLNKYNKKIIKKLSINSKNENDQLKENDNNEIKKKKQLSRNNEMQNCSIDYLIEARENLKKMLYRNDSLLKKKNLNETDIRILKNNKIKNEDDNYQKKTINNNYQDKSDMRRILNNNALMNSIKIKIFEKEKNKKNNKFYENLIKVIFINLSFSNIKTNIFHSIKNYRKVNIYFLIKKWINEFKIGKKITNLLLSVVNKYNEIIKKNKIEIINDNEFLNKLYFSNGEINNEINKYEENLTKIKQIAKEVKEIEKNISDFSNNMKKN